MKHRDKNLVFTNEDIEESDNLTETQNISKQTPANLTVETKTTSTNNKRKRSPEDNKGINPKKAKTSHSTYSQTTNSIISPRRSARLAKKYSTTEISGKMEIEHRPKDIRKFDGEMSDDGYESGDDESGDNEYNDNEFDQSIQEETDGKIFISEFPSTSTESLGNLRTVPKIDMDIPHKKEFKKGIRKIISSMFGQNTSDEDNELDNIMDELADEAWFFNLSEREQNKYIKKIKKLMTYKDNIPTIKDIIDMKFSKENTKILISEKKALDEMDKLSIEYDNACHKFINHIGYYQANRDFNGEEQRNKILDQSKYIDPLHDRILKSNFSDEIKSIIYQKYMTMMESGKDHDAPKYKLWIETALSLPQSPKKINVDPCVNQNQAISNLVTNIMDRFNKKIYGLSEAKEELLCMLGNMIVNPATKNKAIGLYGPPGVGKTLLAKIISEEFGLPMQQIALGGITDSSFLEGHDFTYIGSEPGCIVKAIVRMGYTTGIIFLDEIDKISKTQKGKEIEYALLHITDFTQNHDFRDKYLSEIPIDLSNYIFVYSMNSIDELDAALASRIPVIRFDGYDSNEKIKIVSDYILPEILENFGLSVHDVKMPTNVIQYLIKNVKEDGGINGKSGVRGLKKIINRLVNRINFYHIASVDGKINIKLSFDIPNFSMPYTVTTSLIDQIIYSPECSDKQKYSHMYL